jgi:chromosome segregation ATPase
MTDEELVKQGRAFERDLNNGFPMTCEKGRVIQEMASRIEALTAENKRLERVVKDLSDEADLAEQEACMVEDDFIKAEKEIEALTNLNEALVELLDDRDAKLAKAVEALRAVEQHEVSVFWGVDAEKNKRASWRGVMRKVKAALAEIEGEKT